MTEKRKIPFFGIRRFAQELLSAVDTLKSDRKQQQIEIARLTQQLAALGHLTISELEAKKANLQNDLAQLRQTFELKHKEFTNALNFERAQLEEVQTRIIETGELALLQEAGVYHYRHPLSDAVAYQDALTRINERVKDFVKNDGLAVYGATSWAVNGSTVQGRKMVSETSKLMLRAFNAEVDSAVRNLKPYKLDAAIERVRKVSETIARLGKTMSIGIAHTYLNLRIEELELTADFLHKQAEEKEAERAERERMREERKAQQELERERARLDKEQQHYFNALAVLVAKGDEDAAERIRKQLADVQRALDDVDYRTANIRAGYVYVISNIGSFGEDLVKIGMTRRLDPMDRVRELGDASVPFNFDVHALFFSKDAVGIETAMHQRLAEHRINRVNLRREFFKVTPHKAKMHLADLAGELLQFTDIPDAIEYRESLTRR